jgi:hypothetical protein
LDRLFDSAKAMAFSNVPTRDWIKDAIFKTLIANGMFDNAHIRLTLTRGKKVKYRSRFTRILFLQYVICYLLGITSALILFTGHVFQVKVTSGMSPAFNLYGCALIVLAEWKPPVYDNSHGIKLVTATTRRNSPNVRSSNKLLHNFVYFTSASFGVIYIKSRVVGNHLLILSVTVEA